MRIIAFAACAALLLACSGPVFVEPSVSESDVMQARRALSAHKISPSADMNAGVMQEVLNDAWRRTKYATKRVCSRIFSDCGRVIDPMTVVLVSNETVNAYADARTWQIGVHTGLMRAVGSEEELIAVLGHEAAHLLLGHSMNDQANANAGMLLGMLAGLAAGAALHQPGMDPQFISDMTTDGMNIGADVGRVYYSPEMEIEADQFGMYVLNELGIRLDAGLDMIVRLNRSFVPASVSRGKGWAGYLMTHPPHDYRLAAMQATLNRIRSGVALQLAD